MQMLDPTRVRLAIPDGHSDVRCVAPEELPDYLRDKIAVGVLRFLCASEPPRRVDPSPELAELTGEQAFSAFGCVSMWARCWLVTYSKRAYSEQPAAAHHPHCRYPGNPASCHCDAINAGQVGFAEPQVRLEHENVSDPGERRRLAQIDREFHRRLGYKNFPFGGS